MITMILSCQIFALAGRLVLAAANPVSAEAPVIAEYPRETPAYASFMQSLRVLPLPDQSLAVIHLTRARSESGITATVLRPDGTIAEEWRATDWVQEAAQQRPGDVRLQTNPGQVGQIYFATQLPGTGQLAVSIGWQDGAGQSENGIALVRAVSGSYVAEKVFVLPMTVRDLATGPGNTIVASVFSARAFHSTHQSPTLVVLDTDGKVVGEVFFTQPVSDEDGARNNSEARVIGLPGNRVAFVAPGLGKAFFVRIEPSTGDAKNRASQASRAVSLRANVESVMSLAPPATSLQPMTGRTLAQAIYVDEQERIGVLYSTSTASRPLLTLVQNTAAGASETGVPAPADLRAAYWADGRLQTVMMDGDRVLVKAISREALAR